MAFSTFFRQPNSDAVHRRWTQACLSGLALLVPAGRLPAAVPPETRLEVRLLTPVSSYRSESGSMIRGVVLAPLRSGDRILIPSGATVTGTVRHIRRVGLGLIRERAGLDLDFDQLQLPGGKCYALRARLLTVDNAREHVDRHGRVHGTRATASLSNRGCYRLASVALHHPIVLGALFVLENSVFHFPDPEIDYPSGTEMRLLIKDPLPIESTPDRAAPPDDRDAEELQHLAAGLPPWSYSTRGRPMDLVNLMYVGSEDALRRAFAAAGWTGSQPMCARSGFEVARAIAEDRGYPDAPMRTLVVDGDDAAISLQKGLNDFTKRHHLRIWDRTELFNGRPVWLSAATWDIAAGFSLRLGLTHQIQTDVDLERDKVVNDLVLTGCVDSVRYVRRPDAVRSPAGAWREIETDGALAAVFLNTCSAPDESQFAPEEQPQPGKVFRFFRRLILTARNHFTRDNIFWKSGETAYLGVRAARGWHRQRTEAAAARARRNAETVALAASLPRNGAVLAAGR